MRKDVDKNTVLYAGRVWPLPRWHLAVLLFASYPALQPELKLLVVFQILTFLSIGG